MVGGASVDASGPVGAVALPRGRRWSATSPEGERTRLLRRVLAAADLAALATAYAVASAWEPDLRARTSLIPFALALPCWVVAAAVAGLYDRDDRRAGHSTVDELVPLAQLLTAGVWCGLLLRWALTRQTPTAGAAVFWAASLALVPALRATARSGLRRRYGPQRTLIVGAGEVGQLVARKLLQHPEWGLRLVGFVDARPRPIRRELAGVPVLGTPHQLGDLLSGHRVERVIVAFSQESHDALAQTVRVARGLGVHVDLVPRLFDAIGPRGDVTQIEGLPLVSLLRADQSGPARAAKRALDLVGAALLLVLTAPLFAWIAWRITRDSPGPVFFRQVRLGEGQRPFTLLKFRTMAVSAGEAPHREYVRQIMHPSASPNGNGLYKLDRRADVTPFGAWLRRTSLDELPQLVNVLRGEMSLVGPRPCLAYETELYEPHHFDRFLVPAGMTGLWQVTARARVTLKEALDLDAAYARSWSLGLDLWLLARTPLALLRGGSTT